MRIVLVVVGVVLLVAVGAAIAVRRLDHEAGVWHVDPLTAPTPATPNSYRLAPADAAIDSDGVAPVFDRSAADLAAAFDRVARADDRVDVVGGSPAEGFVTYVQRSALFGFPDYISARFIPLDGSPAGSPAGERSTLAVFSRSRLGRSDLGVNRKRVDGWLDELR